MHRGVLCVMGMSCSELLCMPPRIPHFIGRTRVQIKINPEFLLVRIDENLYMFLFVLWFIIYLL